MQNFFLGFLFCFFLVRSIHLDFWNLVILIVWVLIKFKIGSLRIILIILCFLNYMDYFFLVKITDYIYFYFRIWVFYASYFKKIEIFNFSSRLFFLFIWSRIFFFLIIVSIILRQICVLLLIVFICKFHLLLWLGNKYF